MATFVLPAPPESVVTPSPEFYQPWTFPGDLPSLTVGIYILHAGTPIENTQWRLKSDLVARVSIEGASVVATNHQVDEYGIDHTVEGAVKDLLTSLADYFESLMARESRLDENSQDHLQALRLQLERQ